jgi:hypothetical protein
LYKKNPYLLGKDILLAHVLNAAKSNLNLIQFIMKKILLSAVAVLQMIACEHKEKTVESTDTDVVKETEVIETPSTRDTVVKEVHDENPDGTSVNVSADGVGVSSKSGEKKTEVNIDATKK